MIYGIIAGVLIYLVLTRTNPKTKEENMFVNKDARHTQLGTRIKSKNSED